MLARRFPSRRQISGVNPSTRLQVASTGANLKYLKTKREKLGHLLVNL